MATNRATFFPVGNGDTTLIEVDGKTIQTDINYRDNAENEEQPEYDFAPDLQDACYKGSRNYRLSLFVLTHPDKDHLGGFARIFYCGEPTKYGDRSKNDDKLILVEEMWVSSYASDPNYKTDISESVFDEIERRITLQGTEDGEQNGNRIRVLDTEADVTSGNFSAGIVWKLLAPTPEEAVIEEGDGEENQPSSNDSSLASGDGHGDGKNHLLLGDASGGLGSDLGRYKKQTSELSWHVLLLPTIAPVVQWPARMLTTNMSIRIMRLMRWVRSTVMGLLCPAARKSSEMTITLLAGKPSRSTWISCAVLTQRTPMQDF